MDVLNLSDNLIRLRREKKVTQEELADFIGVTKASVSKWENRQSLPDVLLLPQLAAYFDVTVDELLGYEAQLSKEQIQKLYAELAADFANRPFADAIGKVRSMVRRYYSCYPFLLQVSVLYLNHFILAEGEDVRRELLNEASDLCSRVMKNCTDAGVCGDAATLKAMFDLQLGKVREAVEMLEPAADPSRLSLQSDALLVQAYQLAGETEKAKSFTQVTVYLHLVSFVSASIQDMTIRDPAACEETIRRVEGVLELYHVVELDPNLAAQFSYQAALVYAADGKKEAALEKLGQYEKAVTELFRGKLLYLHGDDYFDRIGEWINGLPLGAEPPRNRELVAKSAVQALSHPQFSELQETEEFKRILRHLSEGVSKHE